MLIVCLCVFRVSCVCVYVCECMYQRNPFLLLLETSVIPVKLPQETNFLKKKQVKSFVNTPVLLFQSGEGSARAHTRDADKPEEKF